MDTHRFTISELMASADLLQKTARESAVEIAESGEMLLACFKNGGKALVFGNGGSAADAQHFAAELVGRYLKDRPSLPALALTVNTSNLTSIANDYGYDQVFARQVQALTKPGDVAIGITTSGRSPNVMAGLKAAQRCNARTIALVGSRMPEKGAAERVIRVPSELTPRVQEAHAVIIHILCDIVERGMFPDSGDSGG